jgi:hypothetical protein
MIILENRVCREPGYASESTEELMVQHNGSRHACYREQGEMNENGFSPLDIGDDDIPF